MGLSDVKLFKGWCMSFPLRSNQRVSYDNKLWIIFSSILHEMCSFLQYNIKVSTQIRIGTLILVMKIIEVCNIAFSFNENLSAKQGRKKR